MAWTDERVEILTKLWAEGLSASQIAAKMGEVSRNAVIGKVHRLGLPGRATKHRSGAGNKPRAVPASGGVYKRRPSLVRPAAALRNNADSAIRVSEHIEVLQKLFHLEDELDIPLEKRAHIDTLSNNVCRWPIGDPLEDDFHYCGCASKEESPYCEFHHGKAYNSKARTMRKRTEVRRLAVG